MNKQQFIKISDTLTVDSDYRQAFEKLGIRCIDDVFAFTSGRNLTKENLAAHRSRLQFEIESPARTLFLKRYHKTPVLLQIRNWLVAHRRKSCASFDYENAFFLSQAGVNTAKIVCFGEEFGTCFEKRSFCISEKIPAAQSLEQTPPDCFLPPAADEKRPARMHFISSLAAFVKKFHSTGFCHRDLYLSHIFLDGGGNLFLIDLARTFKPMLFKRYYRIKDIAQLYYSAPISRVSATDRLRFYLFYTGQSKLTSKDKGFIIKVNKKAERMARHDAKHGRCAPCKL